VTVCPVASGYSAAVLAAASAVSFGSKTTSASGSDSVSSPVRWMNAECARKR
jgi:hypothetical protein